MPELPEVESLRRSLAIHLLLDPRSRVRVAHAACTRADMLTQMQREGTSAARTTLQTEDSLLRGCEIIALHRHGKQLAIEAADSRTLVVHLGMSGQLLFTPSPHQFAPDPHSPRTTAQTIKASHVHARWELVHAATGKAVGELCFRDPRRFGGLTSAPSLNAVRANLWNTLGPDALEITSEQLRASLRSSRRAIKSALLDQSVLAGVGNIYADESLFASRIAPRSACNTIPPDAMEALAVSIRTVLSRAISRGGTTLRDYTDANGTRGSAQQDHRVYGKAGRPCSICKRVLTSERLAQRATVWCPRCQIIHSR